MNNVVNCDVDSFATKDKCDDALSANMHWAQLSIDKLAIGNLRDSLRLSIQQQTAVTTSPSLSNAINHAISRMLEINKADKAEINTLCYGLFEQFKSIDCMVASLNSKKKLKRSRANNHCPPTPGEDCFM